MPVIENKVKAPDLLTALRDLVKAHDDAELVAPSLDYLRCLVNARRAIADAEDTIATLTADRDCCAHDGRFNVVFREVFREWAVDTAGDVEGMNIVKKLLDETAKRLLETAG